MKKAIVLVTVLTATLFLAGCDTSDYASLTQNITDLETSLTTMQEDIDALETALSEANQTMNDQVVINDNLDATLLELEAENARLQEEVASTNTRIKNALNRDEWAVRKIGYNADFSTFEAEYCFGVLDQDWSNIEASDYTHGEGLKFIVTVLDVKWNTEAFVIDSCGNYSEFIFSDSSFGLYSIPADYLEVGNTYEVVFYKDVYFSVPQLGLLPLSEMGEWGAYPEDLSGIVATIVE